MCFSRFCVDFVCLCIGSFVSLCFVCSVCFVETWITWIYLVLNLIRDRVSMPSNTLASSMPVWRPNRMTVPGILMWHLMTIESIDHVNHARFRDDFLQWQRSYCSDCTNLLSFLTFFVDMPMCTTARKRAYWGNP